MSALASLLIQNRQSFRESFRETTNGLLAMAAWVAVYLIVTLAVWVALSIAATGWQPIVVTGGSMEPQIRRGDILLVEDHPQDALVGQRAVVTYRSGDGTGLVTHRVFEVDVENSTYVTKGDANQKPDSAALLPENVVGVGRLVVPVLGLPVVWLQAGDYVSLAALALTAVAAVYLAAFHNREDRRLAMGSMRSAPAIMAIRRARLLVATLITFQFTFDLGRYEASAFGIGRWELLGLTLVGLVAADQVARRNLRPGERGIRLTLVELAIDATVVIGLVVVTGQSRVGWLLMALPLVEAAVHFRLVGALNLWMAMTGCVLVGRLAIMKRTDVPVGDVVAELEQLLDQLGALLLVAIPGAFLAEQLIGDISEQQSATKQAVGRGLLLGQVSQIGREINRLGSDLFDGVTESAAMLGFDAADVWFRADDGTWSRESLSSKATAKALPSPWDWGSGMRPEDFEYVEVIIDPDDPVGNNYAALEHHGYRQLLRFLVADERTDAHVAIRVAKLSETEIVPGSVEAFQLLVAQAAVALQNDQLVEQLQRLNEEMEHRADHDILTGLPNRGQFLRRLQQALDRHALEGTKPAVLFCDLNGFKKVNDTLGHDAGDELLVEVSQRLRDAIGDLGFVARLGGDEFTVLLDDADARTARRAASRIHAAVRPPFHLQDRRAEVGTSVGVSLHQPDVDDEELLRRADVAMYAAKRDIDGSRTAVYSPSLEAGRPSQGRLVAELKRSMVDGSLTLAYQPVVDRNGFIDAIEALLRWQHPELGLLPTDQALDVAESAGITDDLVEWLFATALKDVAWLDLDHGGKLAVVVNVSARGIRSDRLPTIVTDALDLTGQEPSRLRLQTSDPALAAIADPLRWRSSLPQGVGLSVDHFGGEGEEGRGQAAMEFAPLGLETVTLHPLLVPRANRSVADRLKLEAAVAAGRSLNAMVIATGIEEPVHGQLALEVGADRFQGFGVYRPMTIGDVRLLLVRQGLIQREPTSPGIEQRPGAASIEAER